MIRDFGGRSRLADNPGAPMRLSLIRPAIRCPCLHALLDPWTQEKNVSLKLRL